LENYNANQLSIYNRWGDLLYNKANYQLDGVYWDASFKGQPVPDGVYFYVLKVKSTDIVFKNSLTIVRD
ncbi:MAG: gliding motility-associated C-terminal domain-containing protein, partial [Bacteroidota bacterium]